MGDFAAAIASLFLLLHGTDGREVDVNADEITSVHCKVEGVDNKLFAPGVNSVLNLTDGKYTSVRETCVEIRDQMKQRLEERK